jgi:putative transposase
MNQAQSSASHSWDLPEELWLFIEPLVMKKPGSVGSPGTVDRKKVVSGIFYVLRTGCQWQACPRETFGAPSTVHYYHLQWSRSGIFELIWLKALSYYDDLHGLDWQWQSADGALTKAPLGGEATGANPTDRGKSGTKRSLLTDGDGIPMAILPAGANAHDLSLLSPTLSALLPERPAVTEAHPQHLCLDKAYDSQACRQDLCQQGYTPHIPSRKPKNAPQTKPRRAPGWRTLVRRLLGLLGFGPRNTRKARRWVVERTHSWLNRFRKILVRFEKTLESHWGLLQLACATIVLQQARIVR